MDHKGIADNSIEEKSAVIGSNCLVRYFFTF